MEVSSEAVQLTNSNEEFNENGKNASDTVEITSASMGNVQNVQNDHTYFVSSPRRLKRKVDNLLDTVEDLNNIENISCESAQVEEKGTIDR